MNKRYIDFVPVDKKGAKKTAPVRTSDASARGVATAVRESDSALSVRRGAPRRIAAPRSVKAKEESLPLEEIFEEKRRPAGVSTGLEPKFGVIEDYRPKFVRTEVPKRPLAETKPVAARPVAKVAVKPVAKRPMTAPKAVASSVATKSATRPAMGSGVKHAAMRPGVSRRPMVATRKPSVATKPVAKKPTVGPEGPRITKFLNTNKIEKRPLSRTAPKFVPPISDSLLHEEPEKKKKQKKKQKSPERIIAFPEKDSRAGMIIAVILTIILGAAAGTVAFLLLPK